MRRMAGPFLDSKASIRLSAAAPRRRPAAHEATGIGLPPVHWLLKPVRYDRELTMIVVFAVDHLFDVNLVVVVADSVPVADPVAAVGCDANDLLDWLSLDPDPHHPLRQIGGSSAVALPNPPVLPSMSDSLVTVLAFGRATDAGSCHAAQDSLRPG